jgi:hypothetical protein
MHFLISRKGYEEEHDVRAEECHPSFRQEDRRRAVTLDIPSGPDGRHHRSFRRRQVDAAAHDQPSAGAEHQGSIHFNGAEVSRLRGKALRNWQRDCAMIFQQFNLVPRLDV